MKKLTQKMFLVFIGLAMVASPVFADTFSVDNAHSSIGFEVKHLIVSVTKGEFTDYTGTVDFDLASKTLLGVDATIQSASIDTRNAGRDKHLKNPDFFDTETHSTLTFKSTSVVDEGGEFVIAGDLTMRGVTKAIELPVTISGPVQSPFGGTVIGMSGRTTVNRQDWGISWNKNLDQGGVVVSDEVVIVINIEAHKK